MESSADSPPAPASPAVPEKRFRGRGHKSRLSTYEPPFIALSPTASGRPKSTANTAPPTKEQLKAIYSNCLDLFQAKKITVENAFSLRLIECLEDVISSPDFDVTNLQLVGRTLEAGTRIYVCRVDYTYDMVMKLVAQVGAKGKNLDRLRKELENGTLQQGENGEFDPDNPEQMGGDKPNRKERQRKKKSGFTMPLEKIQMKLTENTKCYSTRKEMVKDYFTKFIETRVYFDYDWVLGQVDAIKEAREKSKPEIEEEEAQKVVHTFPRYGDMEMATTLKFLPYIQFPNEALYDRTLYDCWGRPKKGPGSAEEERRLKMEARKVELEKQNARRLEEEERARAEYVFDPNAPTDYAAVNDNLDDDDGFQCHEDGGSEGMDTNINRKSYDLNTNLDDINSMEELKNYYAALKDINAERNGINAWALPAFLRNQRNAKSGVRNRKKKNEQPDIQLRGQNWKEPANRYLPIDPDKMEFDDKVIEKWASVNKSLPFSKPKDVEDDEEEFVNSFMFPCRKYEHYVSEALEYFGDERRNILQQFVPKGANPDSVAENGDWEDLDDDNFNITGIEDMRDLEYNPNSINAGSAPVPSGEFEIGSGGVLHSFMNEFPCSHPGFDFEDDDYDGMLGDIGEGHGVKFARQPKPINMRILKQIVVDILCEKLSLDPIEKTPQMTEETQTDFLALIRDVYKRADEKTQKHLTISLLLVALLHVVVEMKLFLEPNYSVAAVENMNIICRGNAWIHKDHIPMPSPMEILMGEPEA